MTDLRIPLRDRNGRVVAEAWVDNDDEALTRFRWYRLSNGYACRTEIVGGKKRMIYLHRAVFGLAGGDSREVDHIDQDKLNNRRSNLRLATRSEQNQNRGANRNRTLPRGVYALGRKWKAQVKIDGRAHHLGMYDTPEEAAKAAAKYRAEHMPFSPEARPTTQEAQSA